MVDPSLFTGRYDDGLCGALAAKGHDVALHGRPMRDTDAIEPRTYGYSPRFFGVSERGRGLLGDGRLFRGAKALEYLLAARLSSLDDLAQADAVHFQWLPFPLADRVMVRRLGRIREGRRPALVHTVHNASALHGDGGAQQQGYRSMLGEFDALIVHGDTTWKSLRAQGVSVDRLHIVPHPAMTLARASAADLAAVPDPRSVRILFFGTIRPYKGFDTLLEACLTLWSNGADFELAVAGKPFMDIDRQLEQVRDAGFGDRLVLDLGFLREQQLDAHLRKTDIIVFPYRDIDSSGAFLSSLHYGKAMVVSDVGMFSELNPAMVERVPARDAGALAGALHSLTGDAALRARLGEAALAMHGAGGGWAEAAAKTVRVYETAMSRGRHS